ncbi:condensation domain-containing protein [Streptomyces sp. M19]
MVDVPAVEGAGGGLPRSGPGTAPLPALPVAYRDWAHWQRRRFEHGELDGSLRHWEERLGGLTRWSCPPTARARLPEAAGARPWTSRSPRTDRPAAALARAADATVFMTLTAGFQALLARWSGQSDIALGTLWRAATGWNWSR